ncbi:MAG: ribosome biogenesis protein [Candidatus Lokiarchaeota archaeon]|uniref:Ribosome biogenesis protein Nop10 n=1 Tax=marine sediment metagenome TaxID=412755 RepID=X1R3B0_9ZZZZ|nr:ribosome biogenesis protein [Candidatus Lokiarchaeota archaeon]
MTKLLFKCANCGEYSLPNKEMKCKICGGNLKNPKPPKFSLIDKFGRYRKEYFKEEFNKRFDRTSNNND